MKKHLYILFIFIVMICTSFLPFRMADTPFDIRTVASGLRDPWSIVCGPDGKLWVTESKGYRLLIIDPASGEQQVVLDLNHSRQFPSFDVWKQAGKATPQGGVMGLALHPDFAKGKPYVYLSYVYKHLQDKQFLLRLVRYRFNPGLKRLDSEMIICDTIPASNDHNGGRMLIAPVGGKPYLFYAVGDQGSGQFSNGGRSNKAQLNSSYEGKILRLNLDKINDSWIPVDNPMGSKNAVWTTGHRNPQGLAFAVLDGQERLYASEHGPYGDDEINVIEKNGNYGHPLIIGYNDGNYDGLAAAVSKVESYPGPWHTTYPIITSERRNADSIGSAFHAPAKTFYSFSGKTLTKLFERIKNGEEVNWQAYAPSGIAVYQSSVIPGWRHSLLVTSLKEGKLLRLKLNQDGSIGQNIMEHFPSRARYRDVALSADGRKIYLATDSSTITSGPTAESPKATSTRGCILELRYIGD